MSRERERALTAVVVQISQYCAGGDVTIWAGVWATLAAKLRQQCEQVRHVGHAVVVYVALACVWTSISLPADRRNACDR